MALKRLVSLVAIAVLAGAIAAPSVGARARQKSGPAAWQNDPRSGAALNRERAFDPAPAPPAVTAGRFVYGQAVNNPAADSTAQDTQSETTIGVFGENVIVGWNDSGSYNGVNNHFTGYGRSTDLGLTFTDKGTLPNSVEGDAGDPVLAVDQTSGAVYFATLGFNTGNNIQVFKSTDGGNTFGAPVNGTPGYVGTSAFQDKEWMTVDNAAGAGQGNVYLCWTKFQPSGEIRFTRSTNGGATFTPNLGLLLSAGGQGCYVAVGPDHSVYVFYYRGTGGGGQGGDNKLFVRKSTDQGVSFGAEVQVADLLTSTINGDLTLNGGLRSNSFPHAAVDPTTGHLFAVFNDNPADSDGGDIYVVTSIDGGATWSAPAQANNDDGGRDQFFPTVAVSPDGTRLIIGYYSRVQDSSNLAFHRRGRIAKVNAVSGALTWNDSFQLGPNTPVVIGQDPVINTVYMGDYDQIVSTSAYFHSSWADNRDGNSFHAYQPDVRYARIQRAPKNVDLALSVVASPASATVGDPATYKVKVTNNGTRKAQDVFVNDVVPASGIAIQSATGGDCDIYGRFAGCLVGNIAAGATKTVKVNVVGLSAGTYADDASVTTSNKDITSGNNTGTASITYTGSGVTDTFSTGNINVNIIDQGTVEVPLNVGTIDTALDVDARVRLNHTFDGDLVISVVSPGGEVVTLAQNRGGSGDNYGSGSNDCSGTKTVFDDSAATPISAGTPPFAGTFRPDEPLTGFVGDPMGGTWKLRVADTAALDVGTIFCFDLVITH